MRSGVPVIIFEDFLISSAFDVTRRIELHLPIYPGFDSLSHALSSLPFIYL